MSDFTPIVENIFICDCGEVAIVAGEEADCSRCEKSMDNMGWAERAGTEKGK